MRRPIASDMQAAQGAAFFCRVARAGLALAAAGMVWLAATGPARAQAAVPPSHAAQADHATQPAQQEATSPPAWASLAGAADSLSIDLPDGRWRLVVDGLQPAAIRLHDRLLEGLPALPARSWAPASLDGRRRGRVLALGTAPARRSFLVAFDGLDELWEISTDPQAPPIHDGLVHDFRMGEAIAKPGFLTPRRTPLATALRGMAPVALGPWLLLQEAAADLPAGCTRLAWLHLDARRLVQTLVRRGQPDWRGARPAAPGQPPGLDLPWWPPERQAQAEGAPPTGTPASAGPSGAASVETTPPRWRIAPPGAPAPELQTPPPAAC